MNIALLTAAGYGTRMHQDIPKQFLHVENKPVLVYTMEAFQQHPSIDEIIVVTLSSWKDVVWAYAKQFNISKLKVVTTGGLSNQESIYKGLCKLREHLSQQEFENAVVMVHDGNRPLINAEIISDNLAVFKEYGNAVAAIPCTEVVFESEDGRQSSTAINREKLLRTQTPHTYKLQQLLDYHEEAISKNITETAASCMLLKELGLPSYFSKGSEENLKITTVDDLKIFKALLNTRQDEWIKNDRRIY